MRISDWSSDVCSSDLPLRPAQHLDAFQVEKFLLEKAVVDQARIVERHRDTWIAGRRNRLCADAADRDVIASEVGFGEGQVRHRAHDVGRSEAHTSDLQSLMRISYSVSCLTKKQ